MWLSTLPRSILPPKLDKGVGKCVTTETFRLEDLIAYKDLVGLKNFTIKPTGVKTKIAWNAIMKIIIHAIYYVNDRDVTKHTFDAMSTRKSRNGSSDTDTEVNDDGHPAPVNNGTADHVNTESGAENLRDQSCSDIFVDSDTEDTANLEPAKKVPRLSSFDMFAPDSPPAPPANILTPLFDVSTNSADTSPKTVRLQILSIVGVDKFGYIGELIFY